MSNKGKVCVIIPGTTKAACGLVNPYRNGFTRSSITCTSCKKTEHYKQLPTSMKGVK